MEMWRKVWRDGIAPQLSDGALVALVKALRDDDPRIIQGMTCSPPGSARTAGMPVEAACVLGFCGWQAEGLGTVGEVENFFGGIYHGAGALLGWAYGCGEFVEWVDATPRAEMRGGLLAEVEAEQSRRGDLGCACSLPPSLAADR